MSDEIRLLPGFVRYGINGAGKLVSYRKNRGWIPLSNKNKRICLHREGAMFSISPSKFRFCVDHQIDPTTFNAKDYCISAEGEIITYKERAIKVNRISKAHLSAEADCVIGRIKEEISWLQSAIDYYNGNASTLLLKIEDVRTCLIGIVSKRRNVPRSYAEAIVAEAEDQLLSALDRGGVISPKRWLFMRANGICAERKVYRIKDYELLK